MLFRSYRVGTDCWDGDGRGEQASSIGSFEVVLHMRFGTSTVSLYRSQSESLRTQIAATRSRAPDAAGVASSQHENPSSSPLTALNLASTAPRPAMSSPIQLVRVDPDSDVEVAELRRQRVVRPPPLALQQLLIFL